MPASVSPEAPVSAGTKIRHEEWCQPRPGESGPRLESFKAYSDDPASGRSRVTHLCRRCMDCGAASYEQIGV
jgi:hypothetical protein